MRLCWLGWEGIKFCIANGARSRSRNGSMVMLTESATSCNARYAKRSRQCVIPKQILSPLVPTHSVRPYSVSAKKTNKPLEIPPAFSTPWEIPWPARVPDVNELPLESRGFPDVVV
jgi:hypothetical protein